MTRAHRTPALVGAALLGAALLAGAARAQPAVTWEPVGLDSFQVWGLAFAPGPAPDGALDTLYTIDRTRWRFGDPGDPPEGGVHRLPPGGGWSTALCYPYCNPDAVARTASGALLVGSPAGNTKVIRSTDAGRTWARDALDVDARCLYPSSAAFGHAVFACENVGPVWRSPDGAPGTWEPLGYPDPAQIRNNALSLAEALPGPALAGPRLLAAGWSGLSYSDDGGRTWTHSNVWQEYRYYADGGIVRHAVPGHPYGGVLYAGVNDYFEGYPVVMASEDGGTTWEVRSTGPDIYEYRFWRGVVAVDASGGVWVGRAYGNGRDTEGGVVWSGDGARTWADVSGTPSAGGLPDESVHALVVGRDGRLYAATHEGVWRTAGPLPVAAEGGPEGPVSGGLGLAVFPNPAGSQATVALTLGSAGRRAEAVRVVVVDALGREVGVVWDGPAADGQRLALDTSGLAPGTYVVVATAASGEHASAGLSVAR